MSLGHLTTMTRRRFLGGVATITGKNILPAVPYSGAALSALAPSAASAFTNLEKNLQELNLRAAGSISLINTPDFFAEIPGVEKDIGAALRGRVWNAPSALNNVAECLSHIVALMNVRDMDRLMADFMADNKAWNIARYRILPDDIRHIPANRKEAESLLESMVDSWQEQLAQIIAAQEIYYDTESRPFSLKDMNMYLSKDGFYTVFEHDRNGKDTHVIPSITREDIHFLVEKSFLETYGFQARHYPLAKPYVDALDQWQEHPMILLQQWRRYGHEQSGAKGLCDFNRPVRGLRDFSPAEDRSFEALQRMMNTSLQRRERYYPGKQNTTFVSRTFFEETLGADADTLKDKIEKDIFLENDRTDFYRRVSLSSPKADQPDEWQTGYYSVCTIHYPREDRKSHTLFRKDFRADLKKHFGDSIKLTPDTGKYSDSFVLTLRAKNENLASFNRLLSGMQSTLSLRP